MAQIVRAVMLSFAINFFLPAKSGEISKPFLMTGNLNRENLIAGVLMERLCDIFALSLILIIGGVVANASSSIIIGLIIITVLLAMLASSKYFVTLKWPKKIKSFINLIGVEFGSVFKRPKLIIYVLLLCFLNWLLASIQIKLFYNALNVEIGFFSVMAFFPMTVFITLLPLTPGGIGVRESAFSYLFNDFSATHISIIVGLAYYICNNGLNAVFGTLFLIKKNTNKTFNSK